MRLILLMLLIAALPFTGSAQSELGQPTTTDREMFETCLANEPGRDCIGRIVRACDGERDSQTTTGMVACATREFVLWDEYLNDRYRALLDWYAGDEDYNVRQRERIRAAQRIWITARDADCEVEAGRFDGGSLARVIGAGCRMDHTAQRALWLDDQMGEG